ncbi:LysR substrate-binding domain-containing protein [Sphingomonas bacterium]|uniref:LysR substrate-binding domain-containing protein n=1 Tax=Sphingomonas bacterium TaxID=1895847 RepID=UPI003F68B210
MFVTQSALSLQIKRLEELVQQPLFTRDGRKLVLTRPGEILLDYARRVLSLHDEAIAAMSSGNFSGPVRIGTVQDFAETLLTGLLAQFAALHPDAQIFVRIAGTAELQTLLERKQLDVLLGFAASDHPTAIRTAPMRWYGSDALADHDVIPLAVLEKPCRFREAAIASLDAAGRRYRIAVESPNLSALRAAVAAGLGLTCRTHIFLSDAEPSSSASLPALPHVACIIDAAATGGEPTAHLANLAAEVVRGL